MSLKQIKQAIGETYSQFGYTYDEAKLMREHKTTIFKRLYDFTPEMKAFYKKQIESSGLTEEKVTKMLEAKKAKKEKESKKEGVKIKASTLGKARGESSNAKIANLMALKDSLGKQKKELEDAKKETEKMKSLDKEKFLKEFIKVTTTELKNKKEYLSEMLDKLSDKYEGKTELEIIKNKEINKMNKIISGMRKELELKKERLGELKSSEDENVQKKKENLREEIKFVENSLEELLGERDKLKKDLEEELNIKYDKPMEEEKEKLKTELASVEKKLKKIDKVKDEDVSVIKFILKDAGIAPEEFEGNFAEIKKIVETKRNEDVAKEEVSVQTSIEDIPEAVIEEKAVGEVVYIEPPRAPKVYDEQEIKKEATNMLSQIEEFNKKKLKPLIGFEINKAAETPLDRAVEKFKKDLQTQIDRKKKQDLEDSKEFDNSTSLEKAQKEFQDKLNKIRMGVDPDFDPYFDEEEEAFLRGDKVQDIVVKNMIEDERPKSVPEVVGIVPKAPPIPVIESDDETPMDDSDAKNFELDDSKISGKGIGGYYMRRSSGGSSRIGGIIPMDLQYAVCKSYGGFIPARVIRNVMIQPYVNKSLRQITAAGGSIFDIAKGVSFMIKKMKEKK